VAGVTRGFIGFGQEVSSEARHFRRMWHMTSRITAFEPPRRFVDEMARGPFRRFRHEHPVTTTSKPGAAERHSASLTCTFSARLNDSNPQPSDP
jgi:hypothetical protein